MFLFYEKKLTILSTSLNQIAMEIGILLGGNSCERNPTHRKAKDSTSVFRFALGRFTLVAIISVKKHGAL